MQLDFECLIVYEILEHGGHIVLEFFRGFAFLIGYFAISATFAIVLRRIFPIPREVFRKTLHLIFLGSVFILTYAFAQWWVSAGVSIFFMILAFLALAHAEKIPGYSEILTERRHGEIKRSLVIVFTMFTVLSAVCWGLLGQKYLVIASVLAWGLGDAAAALVGKRYGKIYIKGSQVEGQKSLEGTLAMFIVSFISVLVVLQVYSPMAWHAHILIAAGTAAVTAAVELFTRGGLDTITCPFAAAFTLITMLHYLKV